MDLVHDTLRLTREIDHPIDAVWTAYADVRNRTQWSAPDGEQIVHDTAKFTVGGQDTCRCGAPGALANVGTHRYYLVEPPSRLIDSDTVRRDGQLMEVAVRT